MPYFKIILLALVIYFIYAFIFSFLIYAFRNPMAREALTTFTQDSQDHDRKSQGKDRVRLIECPKEGLENRIRIIESAEKTLNISYFTFRDGKTSRMMLAGILDAANRGVRVRMIFDGLSIVASLTKNFQDILHGLLDHENISIKFYDPVNPLFPFNWNKRMHDKIITADESLALMGGRNIADNYFRKDTKWLRFSKDRDVLIYKDESLGDYYSVIRDINDYYDKTWSYKYAKPFKKRLSPRRRARSKKACKDLMISYKKETSLFDWKSYTLAADKVDFVHNPVGKINQDPWCLRELLFLSSQAEESIFMQSPYIIPTRRMHAIFNQYNINLGKTNLLTNSYYSSPNFLSIAAASRHQDKMLAKGVEIYEYQGEGESLHGKTYVFDDKISVIGSFNLDARSSYINSESMIVITSQEFAQDLKKEISIDLSKSFNLSKQLGKEESVPRSKKFIIRILSRLTPLLEHLL